ncbi:MAG TPA: hypothetical protein VF453_07685 [Burkholderiaceae bacterium]
MSYQKSDDDWGTSFASTERPVPRLSAADRVLIAVGVVAVIGAIVSIAYSGIGL